jgi:hypothetical protein
MNLGHKKMLKCDFEGLICHLNYLLVNYKFRLIIFPTFGYSF